MKNMEANIYECDRYLEYASRIIEKNPTYMDFSIAMLDMYGEGVMHLCKHLYEQLRHSPGYSMFCTDSNRYVELVDDGTVLDAFRQYRRQMDFRQREHDFKENIDELQFLISNFRNSEYFKKLLNVVVHFNYLAPYNAMLVYLQKPGASFVLSASKWKKYGRRPKLNAQNLITLIPFGPVQCQYDFSDTEHIPGEKYYENIEMIAEWENLSRRTVGDLDTDKFENLKYNMALSGIFLDQQFTAVTSFGAYIRSNKELTITLDTKRYGRLRYKSLWQISVNSSFSDIEKFSSICHELGHLFCHHFPSRKLDRNLTAKEEEFEAETVAWLVCRRMGITTASEEYLAGYSVDGVIPYCSLEFIMKAVTKIELMMSTRIELKKSDLYKLSKEYRELVDYVTKP